MISPRAVLRNYRTAPLPRPHRRVRTPLAFLRMLEPLHVLWLVIWAPWWVGNELPPPSAPGTRDPEMSEPPEGTAGAWILDTLDDLKFRFGLSWTVALLLRGAWLGGLAGIGWIVFAMLTDTGSPTLTQLAVVVGVGMALGLVLRLFHQPRYRSIALLLERAFGLRSRLSTAVLGLRYKAPAGGTLHELQLADAANVLDRARRELKPIHWTPVREIFIVFIVALTLLLLLVARRPEGEIPPVASTGMPSFVPVSERLAADELQLAIPPEIPDAATLEEVEDISRVSNQARQDLEAIGDAMEGNSVTSPAASAIESEDYPEANQELSDASESVSQLPASEREALADELDEAADRVSEDNAELADSARNASDEVRSGEDAGALDELGDQIEETGESVVSQQASGGELSESSAEQNGESQSGSSGGESSGQGDQQAPADQGAGASQSGSQGDPGAGMEASGGVEASDAQASQSGGAGSDSEGEGAPGDTNGNEGSPGEQQDGSPGDSQAGSGEPSNRGSTDAGGVNGSSDEEDGATQGGGASGGQRDASEDSEAEESSGGGGDRNNEEESPNSGEGEAGDPPPGGPESEGDPETDDSAQGGGSSINLPGTSGDRVSSGSDIGSSSVGTGGGASAASGDSTGGISGSSGPDPNDVPSQWREIVEDYFRDGGAP